MPEDHQLLVPEDKPRSLKAEQALELDFGGMAFALGVEVEGSHPCRGKGSKEVEDVGMRGGTS